MLPAARLVAPSLLAGSLLIFAVAACLGDDPAISPPDGADASSTSDGGSTGGDGGLDATTSPADAESEPTFCSTKAKPAGVADFFCADFDEGDVDDGWTSLSRTDGGVLEPTTSLFVSPPRALLAEARPGEDGVRGGWLTWTAAGPNKIRSVTVDVKINPNVDQNAYPQQDGYVEVAGVDFEAGNVSVRYTDGRFVGEATYEGYYLYGLWNGGGSIEQHMRLPTAPARNAWTTLRLHVTFPTTGSGGAATVTYNGVQIGDALAVPTQITTSVDVVIGARGAFAMSRPAPHRFDDVLVEVVRE